MPAANEKDRDRDTVLHLRVPKGIVDELDKLAKADDRSRNYVGVQLLMSALKDLSSD